MAERASIRQGANGNALAEQFYDLHRLGVFNPQIV
jgi:hypothetical protein